MRNLLGSGTALAMAVALASTAGAEPLNWEGTLTLHLGSLPDSTLSGGGVATLNGAGGLPAHLDTLKLAASRGGISGTMTQFVTDPDTYAFINAVRIEQIQLPAVTETVGPVSGVVASTAMMLTMNTLPVGGLARICLFVDDCSQAQITIPLTETSLGVVTKGIGVGGLLVGIEGVIRISIEAAPWTVKTATAIDQTDDNTGTVAFHTVSKKGFAHGTNSMTTGTGDISGVLQIVTPNQVRTNISAGSNKKVAAIAELLIHFIPEPGLLLLLGSGVVGLVVLGRNRMRH